MASHRPDRCSPASRRALSIRLPMTEITVVVPTRNRAVRLRALLASLAEQPAHEVIVVDNASSDETPAVVAEGGVRGIRLPEPMGPAVARNRGWREARGDLIVFADD